MTRWFNIAGPCKDDIHYMLSPTVRLPDLEELIQQRSYLPILEIMPQSWYQWK